MDNEKLADIILFSQGGAADVRSVVRAVKEFFSKNFERMVELVSGDGYGGRICGVNIKFDMSSASHEAADILSGNEAVDVLVFGGRIDGSIPAVARGRITMVSAGDAISVQDIKKLSPAIALIGVNGNNAARAKELFNNLTSANVATYAYTKDADISLGYYAENGAVDCFTVRRAIRFNDWVRSAVRGIDLSRAENKLFRSNKVINFSVSYKYSVKTCTVTATLHNFSERIAYSGGENAVFVGKASIPEVTFNDIIGAEEAKREFAPVIRQLKNYGRYTKNGIRIPRGIILDGPPGCGKTSVAKAVANAAGLPFIPLNATEFLSKWVGEGERKVHEIFAIARRYAPSIVFIDEIDCIAKDRMGDESKYTQGLTNALLSELDGFNSDNAAPVFVIAATNFDTRAGDGKLDKAFLRRFDKKIHIDLPKAPDRELYILRELAKYRFSIVSKEMASNIASRSVGWSLADLNLVIQNAVRHSEGENGDFALTDDVLEEAFSSFNAGEKRLLDAREVRKTACHEAGHAVAAALLGLKPVYATIVARGGYNGYMQYSDENKSDMTRAECLNMICVFMAGRAGEVCFYGDEGVTAGAGNDIGSATALATRMVCVYGMEDDMLCSVKQGLRAGDGAVYRHVQDILLKQYGRALQLVRDNADKVDAVAKALAERESLTGSELTAIISSI